LRADQLDHKRAGTRVSLKAVQWVARWVQWFLEQVKVLWWADLKACKRADKLDQTRVDQKVGQLVGMMVDTMVLQMVDL
jgi:hypothetical protein